MSIEIIGWEATYSPPDSDGDIALRTTTTVEVSGEVEIDLFRTRAVITTDSGMPVALLTDDEQGDFGKGDTAQLSASTYSKIDPGAPMEARIQVEAVRIDRVNVAEFPLPAPGTHAGEGREVELAPGLKVLGWMFSASPLDSDGDSPLRGRVLVSWEGEGTSPALECRLRLFNRRDEEFDYGNDSNPGVPSGGAALLEPGTWLKSQWVGKQVTIRLAVSVHHIIARAVAPPVTLELGR